MVMVRVLVLGFVLLVVLLLLGVLLPLVLLLVLSLVLLVLRVVLVEVVSVLSMTKICRLLGPHTMPASPEERMCKLVHILVIPRSTKLQLIPALRVEISPSTPAAHPTCELMK